nr:hypothetical protein Iba_chr06cCG2720 [Ipomoea batatas]
MVAVGGTPGGRERRWRTEMVAVVQSPPLVREGDGRVRRWRSVVVRPWSSSAFTVVDGLHGRRRPSRSSSALGWVSSSDY